MRKIKIWDCETGDTKLEINVSGNYEEIKELANHIMKMEKYDECDYDID